MRTLLGVVVGMVLAAALVAAIGAFGAVGQATWTVIPAGLVVGLFARKMTAGDPPSYMRGALAAVATVGAMILGQMGAANLISKQAPVTGAAPKVAAVEQPADEGAEEAEEAAAPTVVITPDTPKTQPVGTIGMRRQEEFPVKDAIMLAVGCLVAYQTGKGAAAGSSEEDSESETSEAEQAAADDQSADDQQDEGQQEG